MGFEDVKIATPPDVPAPGSEEELRRFARIQERLRRDLDVLDSYSSTLLVDAHSALSDRSFHTFHLHPP